MTFGEAKSLVRSRFPEYLERAKKGGQFVCPLCGHGRNGDGLLVVPAKSGGDGAKLHCFGCGFHGDLIDLVGKETGKNFWESFVLLCRRFGVQVAKGGLHDSMIENISCAKQDGGTGGAGSPRQGSGGGAPGERRFSADRSEGASGARSAGDGLEHPQAGEYLSSRGISIETARRFGLRFVEDWVSPAAIRNLREQGRRWTPPGSARVIIPASEGGYTARATDPDTPKRLRKMKEGPAGIFNPEALYNPEGRPVFVTEGEFDALSVAEAGGLAVALGSVGNRGKLLSLLEGKRPSGTLILALDNDKAGQDASLALSDGLRRLSVPFTVSDIAGGHKDASEALTGDKRAFLHRVAEAEAEALKNPDGVAAYMDGDMAEELKTFRKGAFRRTGFEVLDDEAGGIYPGLYVLGAISSLGKTTFLHQMADQMAGMGQHVIYFSLEQGRLELVSKSIARMAAVRAGKAVVSSLGVRIGAGDENASEEVSEAFKAYRESVGDRLSVVEGGFDCTVGRIREYVEGYIARFRVKPVVVVDYLQILQGESEPGAGARERIDGSVIGLKRVSRDMGVPVFVVSSVNRSNYLAPIDFESFKESGGIEYTADVVWGLQLEVLGEELFGKEGKLREKRERIRRAKMEEPRRVELVCLKNRYGRSSYRVGFEYFAGCDWFRDVMPRGEGVRR